MSIAVDPTSPASGDTADELIRMALAIGSPGTKALLIDADNKKVGWVSMEAAVEQVLASESLTFAVTVRDDVLAIDCDCGCACRPGDGYSQGCEDGCNGEDRTIASLLLRKELVAMGLDVALIGSGRPGNTQIFALVPDSEQKAVLASRAKAMGFDVRSKSNLIRPPLIPHRLRARFGYYPTLIAPETPGDLLTMLEGPRRASEPHGMVSLSAQVGLHVEARQKLRNGDGRYRSGSELTRALAGNFLAAGMSLDQLRNALRDPANAGGASYRRRLSEKGPVAADNWLRVHIWKPALEWRLAHRGPRVPERPALVHEWTEAVNGFPWSGVGGATRRSVLSSVARRAVQLGTEEPDISCRQAADMAGVTKYSASKALQWAVANGWLVKRRPGRGHTVEDPVTGAFVEQTTGTIYKLTIPVSARVRDVLNTRDTGGTPPLEGLPVYHPFSTLPIGHDAARWGALGKNAPAVHAAYLREPGRPQTVVARELGVHRGTIHNNLIRLQAVGLAGQTEQGLWYAVEGSEELWNAAAENLGPC